VICDIIFLDMENSSFEDFVATHLFCYRCKMSVPVKERLLLILPEGYLFEYICPNCGESLGERRVPLKDKDRIYF